MKFRCYCIFIAVAILLSLYRSVPVSAEETQASVHHYASALMEAESGTLLGGTDSDVQVPIGSLTKLMTVYLAAEAVAEGSLTLQTQLTAPPSAQEVHSAVIWLTSGEKMSVEDLLKAVIIGNANDAAVTLAIQLAGSLSNFVGEMNAAAFSLEMRSTRFADCTGESAENLSTARDIAKLCRILLKYEFLRPAFTTWRTFLRDGKTELVSENTLTRTYEGILGCKAGHGDACGYTLAIAAKSEKMCCIAVVLGCDEEQERFTYGKNLLANGFSNFCVTTPDFQTEFLRPLPVAHGNAASVCLCTDALLSIAAPIGAELSGIVVLPKYAEAPVRKGQPLGNVAVYCGDSLVYEVPLLAAASVSRRSFLDSFAVLLENLFK